MNLDRIIIAVDPALNHHSETGIVAAGVDKEGYIHVLADASDRMDCDEWAVKTANLMEAVQPTLVVGELTGAYGDFVERNLRRVVANVCFKGVSSKPKPQRLLPLMAAYESGRVKWFKPFHNLRTQVASIPLLIENRTMPSDRADALALAFHELTAPFYDVRKIRIL